MAPDELSTCARAPDTFSRKSTAPSAPRTLSWRVAFLISAMASLMRLMGKSERHPNALARNRDRKLQLCAVVSGMGCSPKNLGWCSAPIRAKVRPAAGRSGVRVLSCQALFHHASGLLLANFGDEILPGLCVSHPGNAIIRQDL